jgi:protoheme ferro-lyase
MALFAESEMKQRGADLKRREKRGLLLGAHGTIVSPLRNIKNTGYEDTLTLYNLLINYLSRYFERTSIAWLNHRRGGEWTSPSLQQAAEEMLASGIIDLVYFPFGFLADNEETQLTTKTILKGLGITDYTHLPCVNADSRFMQFLAEVVLERYKGTG